MRIQAVAEHTLVENPGDADFACHQRACGISAAIQGVLLIASVIVVMAPFSVVAAEAIAQPTVFDRLTGAPARAAGALAGVAIWLFMFGIPAWRAFARMGRSQTIRIAGGLVEVSEKTMMRTYDWVAPLSEFQGISHNVRTNVSGTRQELILVHPHAAKCLLLGMKDTISQTETDDLAARLNVPVLPTGFMHRRRQSADLYREPANGPLEAMKVQAAA
jgi:hypothetical protein